MAWTKEQRKAWFKEYNSRPEVRSAMNEYHREYRKKPEVKKYRRERARLPEAKAKVAEYKSKPEIKERYRQHRKRYSAEGRYSPHGVTLEQKLDAMWQQGGLCQICTQPMTLIPHQKNSAQVDHDHKTGKFRGMLCALCNKGLGLFQDDTLFLEGAAEYLRKCA